MPSLISKRLFRETIVFAGLLAGALLLSTLFGDHAFATDLISGDDNLIGGESDLKTFVFDLIQFFLGFLGAISVIMLIYAGVLYVTSAGNDEAVGKAKKIMLYAAIGIVIIFASYAIVTAIFNSVGAGPGGSQGEVIIQ